MAEFGGGTGALQGGYMQHKGARVWWRISV